MGKLFPPVYLVLFLVAVLWGVGFAPQRLALDGLAPIAFNFWRFIFGALSVLIVIFAIRVPLKTIFKPSLIYSGFAIGLLLFIGAGFQQLSLAHTKVANVAFITGFYVALVPVIGLFFSKRYPLLTWLGGGLAIVGLALLSGFDGQFSFLGDALALAGAVFWALHLWAITYWVGKHHALCLAFYQFLACALFSFLASVFFEPSVMSSNYMAYLWAFLSGVFVVGLAFTLQVIALKHADPFIAAIIFSFESVFGALMGYWIFEETLGQVGLLGALLMFLGFVLAQSHERQLNSKNTSS